MPGGGRIGRTVGTVDIPGQGIPELFYALIGAVPGVTVPNGSIRRLDDIDGRVEIEIPDVEGLYLPAPLCQGRYFV